MWKRGDFGTDVHDDLPGTIHSTLPLNRTAWEAFRSGNRCVLRISPAGGLAKNGQMYYEWTDAQTEEPNDGSRCVFRAGFPANYMLIGSHQLDTRFMRAIRYPKADADEETMRRLWDNYYVPYIHTALSGRGSIRSDDLKTGRISGLCRLYQRRGLYPDQAGLYDDGNTEEITTATYFSAAEL